MAHEVSHIRNYDIRLSTIALALTAAIALLANIGTRMMWFGGGRRSSNSKNDNGSSVIMLVISIVLMILAPLAATLVQLALSRNREYLADASAVELTRNTSRVNFCIK